MSGARAAAAAKKKTPQTSSSPKKRKEPDSKPTQNPDSSMPSDNGTQSLVVSENGLASGNAVGSQEVAVAAAAEAPSGMTAAKKVCGSVQERTAELKSKIGQLKKKAGDFDLKSVACWKEGERVPFLFICLAFDLIANETGRIVITDIVCNMLRTVMHTTPDDLVAVVYLSANRIAPAHEGLELGIGDASIIKALAEACGRTETQVKKQYKVMPLSVLYYMKCVCILLLLKL